MLTILCRTVIIYILVLFVLRYLGKKQIGEMQPIELVVTLIIADLACNPMADTSIPFLYGIIPILVLVILHQALNFFITKFIPFRTLVVGKPAIVINPDGIDYEVLKKLDMNAFDLLESLRQEGYFNLSEIQYAIFETTGKISVLLKNENLPATKKDIHAEQEISNIPLTVVIEGQIINKNLEKLHFSKDNLIDIIFKQNIKKIKDLAVVTLDENGEMFIQPKFSKSTTLNVAMEGN